MSVRLMAAVFDLDLPAGEKLVLLAMADHARDDGTGCYPSVDRLARKSSLSRRGVQQILRRLEDAGFVVPTARFKGGRSLTTEYRITLEKGAQGALFSATGGRTAAQGGAHLEAGRAHADAQKGALGAPESLRTIIEPSGNRQSAPQTGAPEAQAKPRPSPSVFSGLHLNVSAKQDQALADAFPWFDREAEYRKADSWLEANPTRRPRKTGPFLHNWFNRIPAPNPNGKGGTNADERTRTNLAAAGLLTN